MKTNDTRATLAFVGLIASLVLFMIALLITTGALPAGTSKPWAEGGFVALVFSLLMDDH